MTHFNNQKWWPLKSGCHSKEATFHEKNLVENIMRSEGGSDILSGTPCPMSCALSSYTEKKKNGRRPFENGSISFYDNVVNSALIVHVTLHHQYIIL